MARMSDRGEYVRMCSFGPGETFGHSYLKLFCTTNVSLNPGQKPQHTFAYLRHASNGVLNVDCFPPCAGHGWLYSVRHGWHRMCAGDYPRSIPQRLPDAYAACVVLRNVTVLPLLGRPGAKRSAPGHPSPLKTLSMLCTQHCLQCSAVTCLEAGDGSLPLAARRLTLWTVLLKPGGG
jgi:hypothetical protein